MQERQIVSVADNDEKRHTYAVLLDRYNKALKYEYYFEALLIDYALMEDRLRSFLYHIGALANRQSYKVGPRSTKPHLQNMVRAADTTGKCNMGITSISGKMALVKATIKWAESTSIDEVKENRYLAALKTQYDSMPNLGDLDPLLDTLQDWCKYRNEVIHALMNKNLESLNSQLAVRVDEGMQIARRLDAYVRSVKKYNRIRRSVNLPME